MPTEDILHHLPVLMGTDTPILTQVTQRQWRIAKVLPDGPRTPLRPYNQSLFLNRPHPDHLSRHRHLPVILGTDTGQDQVPWQSHLCGVGQSLATEHRSLCRLQTCRSLRHPRLRKNLGMTDRACSGWRTNRRVPGFIFPLRAPWFRPHSNSSPCERKGSRPYYGRPFV